MKFSKPLPGKTLLQLLSKHFPKDHQMHKILNRNTVQVTLLVTVV